MRVQRGTARAMRRNAAAPSLRIAEYRLSHDFDDDAVCVKCGFDGAEWWHYRQTQHPDDRDPNERQPECTR